MKNIFTVIKEFIFGRSAKGENIITKKPSVNSTYPPKNVEFNDWARSIYISVDSDY